jgi:cytochrome oxidase Cu insertion factor (SCO1/SenC/PrrC family)
MARHTTGASLLPLGLFIAWLAITMMWWGLAFAPLPASPPEWLVVAKQVCFGMSTNGLPEGYGWMLLVLGPGPMLGFLLAVWGGPLWGNIQTLSRSAAGRVVLGLLVAIPLAGALWVGQRIAIAAQIETAYAPVSPATALPPDYPRLERPAPDMQLLDQHGNLTSLAAHRGQVIVLAFAFGHCQTICLPTVQNARTALESISGVSSGLWVVTLDPWRDTPGALPGLASRWRLTQANTRVLSADVDTVLDVLRAYHVPHQRDLRTGDITHPALVYIIDGHGRIAYAFNNPSRTWLAEAVRRAARADLS